MFSYNNLQNESCLGPGTTIKLCNPSNDKRNCRVQAIVDTGAVMTIIPQSNFRQLGDLLEYSEVGVKDVNGNIVIRPTYIISITIDEDNEFSDIEAIVMPKSYAIIGRDILNQCKVVLDAPLGQWRLNCMGSCDPIFPDADGD
jgi:gag-polyprotein putative aspartyl protease